jgi:hypothetical protein
MDGPGAVVVKGMVFVNSGYSRSCDHIAETLKPRPAFLQAPFSPGSPTTGAAHSKAPLSTLIGRLASSSAGKFASAVICAY